MNVRTRIAKGVLSAAFVALGGFGIAVGQDAADGATDADQADANDGGELQVEQGADLSPAEQLAEADRIVSRATTTSRHVGEMLDEARHQNDILRVTCLNDKFTQINTNLETANARVTSLRGAISGNDDDLRDHEFTVISVLGIKFRTLEQEANQCVGQDIFETGTTSVETTVDPNAPNEDPSQINTIPDIEVVLPPPATPTS